MMKINFVKKSVVVWVMAMFSLVAIPLQYVAAAEESDEIIEEVLVTGSFIKRKNQSDLASPINIIGLEEINRTGFSDLEDIAETMTYNTSSFGRSDLAGGCCGTSRSIDIRALGISSTLVLQNGKRVASSSSYDGSDFTNIKSLMPVIALQSMETLLDGAAALYGSDAVAGVVNLTPRKDFEGFEMRIGGKDIDASGQHEAQFIVGAQGERYKGILAVGYEHIDHMRNADRPFTLLNNTSSYGSPGTHILQGRPFAVGGGDLLIDTVSGGLVNYSTLYDANASAAGTLQVADPSCYPALVPAYGAVPGGGQPGADFPLGLCKSTYQPHNSITPEEDTFLVYSVFDVEINDYMNLELEYSGYRRQSRTEFIGSFPQTNGSPVVPGTNPRNPFGVDTEWRGRFLGLAYPPTSVKNDGDAQRFAATLTGDLNQFIKADWADSWTYSLSAQYSDDANEGEAPDTDLISIQHALNGFGGPACNIRFDGPAATETAGKGGCYYVSPFGADLLKTPGTRADGYASVFQVGSDGQVIYPDQATTMDVLNYSVAAESLRLNDERTLQVIEGHATGDVMELGGGMMGLAIGFQHRDHHRELMVSNFGQTYRQGFLSPSLGGEGGRNVLGIFAEANMPFTDRLEVNVAVRREEYENYDSVDPKFSAKFGLMDGLTLRASWGTSFRAASLGQVTGNDANSRVDQTYDPLHPDEDASKAIGTFRTILIAKNPDLMPEESTNYNIGISWQPEQFSGFQADIDYFNYEFEKKVRAESAQDVLSSDPCGPNITRDTTSTIPNAQNLDKFPNCPSVVGPVTIVQIAYFNTGSTAVSGIDANFKYGMDVFGGEFTANWVSTYMMEYDVQTLDGGPITDGAGWRNFGPRIPVPELRTNVILNFMKGDHNYNLTTRHVSSLKDDIGGRPATLGDIDSMTEIDVQYSYNFGERADYTISVGAQNVTDEMPPTIPYAYLARLHNPFGRQMYARFGMSLE
jgi:iron complex outermembrane receptor protein